MPTEERYIAHERFSGDTAAFGSLMTEYKARIHAFAYRKLGNFQDAEDITQEVFLKAYLKLNTLKQQEKFLSWLYAIAFNLCKDFSRSASHRLDSDYLADQGSTSLESLSMCSYHECEICESLHETLEALPEKYRQVLILHYLDGLSCREIAQVLGTSPHAIDMRLTRARFELRKKAQTNKSVNF